MSNVVNRAGVRLLRPGTLFGLFMAGPAFIYLIAIIPSGEGCASTTCVGSRGGPRSSSKAVNTRPGGQIGLTPWARGENNA